MIVSDLIKRIREVRGTLYVPLTHPHSILWVKGNKNDLLILLSETFTKPDDETYFIITQSEKDGCHYLDIDNSVL